MGRPKAPAALSTESTIAALLAESARRLKQAGIEGARSEARWLLAHVTGEPESVLLAHGEREVPADARARFDDLIARRAAREPFAYLVGERELYGRRFVVDARVLVPRPETETLIEAALDALASSPVATPLVVDVGTGSGAIACTLALERPDWRVVGSDLSADALAVAAINRRQLGLERRFGLVCGRLLDWLRQPADLVVANLPYIPSSRVPELMPEVSRWEPTLALDGGEDGTVLIRRLLEDARRVVRPGGTIVLELDPEQIPLLTTAIPGVRTQAIRDLAGLDRVLRVDLP